jgi:hypothetical protein
MAPTREQSNSGRTAGVCSLWLKMLHASRARERDPYTCESTLLATEMVLTVYY